MPFFPMGLAPSVDEVVRLVYKKGVAAALGEEAANIHYRIEEIVEVADDNVTQL